MSYMKYFLLFLIITNSFLVKADWIRGTITMNSGEEKTGYIKEIKNGDEAVIEFKVRLKDEPLEISSQNVKELLLRTNDGSMVTKYLIAESIGSNGEYKSAKSETWMRVAFRGDFDVMCLFSDSESSTDYYINWPSENNARLIYIDDQKGMISFSKEELLRKSVSFIFLEKCDLMISQVNNDLFNPEGIGDVLRYYVENCKAGVSLK